MFSSVSNFLSGKEDEPKPTERQHHDEDGQSLTTVLSSSEHRTALLLLIANCTESMRKTLTDNFDPRLTTRDANAPLSASLLDLGAEPSEEEKRKKAEDRERDERARRIDELSSPAMQDLKKASLAYFDDWRDRVLERVGEAINARPAVDAQKKKAEPHVQDVPDKKIDSVDGGEVTASGTTAMHQLYPPRDTTLSQLAKEQRILILHSLLLIVLGLERYPAESRVLLLQVAGSLHLPLTVLTDDETKVARGLLEAAQKQMSADDETKKKAQESAESRKWKVGLGTVAGAALIGVTGGLAAPLLAAGVGSVMGGIGLGATAAAGYLGALAGSAPLVGVLFGAYGGRMTGQAIDRYAREVEDFAFLPVHDEHAQQKGATGSSHNKDVSANGKDTRRLRVAIGISGWLTSASDIVTPWLILSPDGVEPFALRYELDAMMSLGNALTTMLKSYAWGWAKGEIIKRTVFASLTSALWPLGLLKVSRVVDNPFSIAKTRSDKAGVVLADALINKVQGERPVTLVGYSLGARVIYSCLNTLAERKAFGLVENVVLLGSPTPSDSVAWRRIRSVVAARVVNVYSTNDYLLAFLYRTASIQLGVAGLQPIGDVLGVENVDVTELVHNHTEYRFRTGTILKKIGIEDLDVAEVEKQEHIQKIAQKKEEEERKANMQGKEEDEVGMQKEVEKKKQEGLMGFVSNTMSSMGLGGVMGGQAQGGAKHEGQMTEEQKMAHAGA